MRERIAAILAALLLLAPQAVRTQAKEVRLPVVMYPHISKNPAQWNDYVISPEEFEDDLRYLSSHGWESVGVRELLAWQTGEFEMPEKPFMLTFDDGFESTLAYAEPLLAEYGFHGVVAVIGSVCEKFTRCDEHDPELSNLSWEDAAAMAARGVIEVQCHTWDMHGLSARRGCQKKPGESAAAYTTALSADLEQFLQGCRAHGVEIVPSIAYPYGLFCADTNAVAQAEGFRLAFTCDETINMLRPDAEGFLLLGRFNRPHGPGGARFFAAWEQSFS